MFSTFLLLSENYVPIQWGACGKKIWGDRLWNRRYRVIFALCFENAGVVELVDTLDLGSSAARFGGSSPSTRTKCY